MEFRNFIDIRNINRYRNLLCELLIRHNRIEFINLLEFVIKLSRLGNSDFTSTTVDIERSSFVTIKREVQRSKPSVINIRVCSFSSAQRCFLGNVFSNSKCIRSLCKCRSFVHVNDLNSSILLRILRSYFSINNSQSDIERSFRCGFIVKGFIVNASLCLDNKRAQMSCLVGFTHLNNFEKVLSAIFPSDTTTIVIRYGNHQFIKVCIIFIIDDNLLAFQFGAFIYIFFNFVRVRQHLEFRRSIDIRNINNNCFCCRLSRINKISFIIKVLRIVHNLHDALILFLLCIVQFLTVSNSKCPRIGIEFKREVRTTIDFKNFFDLISQLVEAPRMHRTISVILVRCSHFTKFTILTRVRFRYKKRLCIRNFRTFINVGDGNSHGNRNFYVKSVSIFSRSNYNNLKCRFILSFILRIKGFEIQFCRVLYFDNSFTRSRGDSKNPICISRSFLIYLEANLSLNFFEIFSDFIVFSLYFFKNFHKIYNSFAFSCIFFNSYITFVFCRDFRFFNIIDDHYNISICSKLTIRNRHHKRKLTRT